MNDKQLTLAAARAEFEQKTLAPIDASDLQRREMRQAFYSGARSFFDILMQGLGPGDEPTDGDMNRLKALHAELQRFGQDVQQRRA